MFAFAKKTNSGYLSITPGYRSQVSCELPKLSKEGLPVVLCPEAFDLCDQTIRGAINITEIYKQKFMQLFTDFNKEAMAAEGQSISMYTFAALMIPPTLLEANPYIGEDQTMMLKMKCDGKLAVQAMMLHLQSDTTSEPEPPKHRTENKPSQEDNATSEPESTEPQTANEPEDPERTGASFMSVECDMPDRSKQKV